MATITNTGLQTTDKKLYFLAVDTQERLEIQFVPNEVAPDRTTNISTIDIIGRNNPKYQYLNGETLLTLELDFYADEQYRTSVVRKCNWLIALTYNDKGRKPPQRVALVFGDLFKREIWTVRSVKPKYSDFAKTFNFMPKQAYVTVVLCLDVDFNQGWEDVQPNYAVGLPDGSAPYRDDVARRDDEDYNTEWMGVTNENDFATIRRRAIENLGLTSSLTHGYYR